jgi:hypothetical protein
MPQLGRERRPARGGVTSASAQQADNRTRWGLREDLMFHNIGLPGPPVVLPAGRGAGAWSEAKLSPPRPGSPAATQSPGDLPSAYR